MLYACKYELRYTITPNFQSEHWTQPQLSSHANETNELPPLGIIDYIHK